MISMRRAFTKHTTTRAHLVMQGEGYYDENNEWVAGESTAPVAFNATITPVGMADYSSFGHVLEALPEGERVQSYIQISSTIEVPINSHVLYLGNIYKIIRDAEYRAAGFYTTIGENIRGKEAEANQPDDEEFDFEF